MRVTTMELDNWDRALILAIMVALLLAVLL
jgi:hypothetical protein